MMIQAQYFQTLLQAKIYLNFVLRNSPFSAPRKVDKNTQRMVTKRYYYRCEKGCQSTSLNNFQSFKHQMIYLSTLKSV